MQVAPGTSTSDLTEETLETPGVSIDEDASLATLTGTSGVNENNVPDNCAVWAWLQKSIPDEEDLWIAKVVSVTNESGTYFGISLLLSLVRSAIQILGSHWNEDQKCGEKKGFAHGEPRLCFSKWLCRIQVACLCLWWWGVSACEVSRWDSEWACGFVRVCVCLPGFMSPKMAHLPV
nr:uncharacterized protein LOC123840789 isoform X2 [Mirounga angustirostris]